MQRINRIKNRIEHTKWLCFAGAFVAVCFLSGCTRKEELLILTKEAAAQETISEAAENGEAKNVDLGDAPILMQEDSQRTEASAESSILYVHVCGAVKASGVYELPAGSRVYEAVQAAGGFSEDADQSYVNQARILSDGVKLVIPTVEEVAAAAKSAGAADSGKSDSDAATGEKSVAALQIGIIGEGDAAGEEIPGQTDAKQADGKVNINTATKQELCGIPGVGETRAAAIITYREAHGGFGKPEDIMKVNGIKEGMYEKIKDSISVE